MAVLAMFMFSNGLEAQSAEEKTPGEIETYVDKIMDRYGIPGAAVAVIKDGEEVYKGYFGKANLEHQVPVTDRSIFRVYSLTKTIVATAVFQLIEQQKLSLEDAVSEYVPDLPENWSTIQLKYLLTHSSGLPDMAPLMEFENLIEEEAKQRVFSEQLRFQKGEKYEYNQTGFWLLQKVIEKASGKKIEDFIVENQFGSRPEEKVFFSSDSRDIIPNRVTPYFPFRTGKKIIDHSYLQGRYLLSTNGLNITLDDYILWDRKFSANKFLKEETKEVMFSAFEYAKPDRQFAYSWDIHNANGHLSYGFSGSLVTAYRIFPGKNISVIFLSNGLEKYFNIENIIDHIAGLLDSDLKDIEYELFENLLDRVTAQGLEGMLRDYTAAKKSGKFTDSQLEDTLNSIGYFLLRSDHLNDALEVFLLNTKEYPNSWNVWDSLAEGYESQGNVSEAIKYYKKSVSLNPKNTHGTERLKVLQTD